MLAHRLEEILVDLPFRIVRAYVALISIDEMRRVAHDQVPHFRTWNAFKIIRLINRNAVAEFVDAHCVPARRNCRWVDVRQAKCFAKAMPKHGEADEAGTGAPFETALLFRHSSRFEKRNELLPELGSSSVAFASIA